MAETFDEFSLGGLREKERRRLALERVRAGQMTQDFTFGQNAQPVNVPSEYNPQEFNIRGKAQGQYNQEVLKNQAQLLDTDKFNKTLSDKRAQTNSIAMFLAAMRNRPFTPQSIRGPSRRGTTSTKPDVDAVDIEKELAWDEWLHNPGETMDDLVLFTKRKNLSGDTFKYLADRFAAFDKGKKIPMYRWNEAKKNYDTIFRREGDDLEKERTAGFRLKIGDIKAGQEASLDVEISGALTKANKLFLSDGLKTNKDFQSFIKNNGITNHKVLAALQSAYPNLIGEDDRVAMYNKEGNPVYVPLKDKAEMLEKGYTLPDEFQVGQNRRVNEIIAEYIANVSFSENEVKEGVLARIRAENLLI